MCTQWVKCSTFILLLIRHLLNSLTLEDELMAAGTDLTAHSSFSKEDLIECGHGRLFGEGNAQLPIDKMLMIDRVVSITKDGGTYGKGQIVAELDIDQALWFLNATFQVIQLCRVA